MGMRTLRPSTFKPNRLVSSPLRLLFLSWIYAIPVDPLGYAAFVGYVMRETKGRADGGEVTRMIREQLGLG